MPFSTVLWNTVFFWQLASCAHIGESPAMMSQDAEVDASSLLTGIPTAAAPIGSTVPDQSSNCVDTFILPNGDISASASAAPSVSDPSVSLVEVSASISGTVTPPPTPLSTCQPGVCWGNASDVSIFYWPQKSAQTACLASLTQTRATFPSGLNP
ncbi:hypothetical protein MMC28_008050 [Mycoblastus sanguinarius]|nr:hypothetical protein [Mycoblastus sanguinarius]